VTGDREEIDSRSLKVEREELLRIPQVVAKYCDSNDDTLPSDDCSSFELRLYEGTLKVPVQVVLPAYLHSKSRHVKLHVKEGRKFLGS
jgi:hypothetical protein